jgi:hypothetical protein
LKTTIKNNLIIFHNPYEWETIQHQLAQDHGTKILISYVCKRELGFTIRRHKGLVEHSKETWEIMKIEGFHNRYHYEEQIHLDFYSKSAMSWFVLKYLNR